MLKELLRNHRFRVLYALQDINYYETVRVVEYFKDNDVELFDFVLEEQEDNYFSNFPVRNKIFVKKDTYEIN